MPNDKIAERLTCQKTKFNELKNDACVEFPERLDYWKKEHTEFDDLLVFESIETTKRVIERSNCGKRAVIKRCI